MLPSPSFQIFHLLFSLPLPLTFPLLPPPFSFSTVPLAPAALLLLPLAPPFPLLPFPSSPNSTITSCNPSTTIATIHNPSSAASLSPRAIEEENIIACLRDPFETYLTGEESFTLDEKKRNMQN
ncbi:hypothetical protein VNO78_15159 [Psophocarpus tetragonolobus]|uniref:Uncharacterized protein n=1 Tax=Psophocarpus tetragonolobus TaxID=3891 RepID=A0AAN9SEU1_PSOTE